MFIGNEKELIANMIDHPEAREARMKVLISPEQGWSDYVMRVIELEEDGCTPKHSHDWPHINYMIEGRGLLHMDGKNTVAEPGGYAYVPAGMTHQFRNTGSGQFRFICIVPKEGHI